MNNDFLTTVKQQFLYYKGLGEKAIEQVPDVQLNWQYNADSNSIAMIVHHLRGNMLSRWTDFLTTDGEKASRNRDAEFDDVEWSREDVMKHWEEGWKCVFDALDDLHPDNWNTQVYIRNQGHTVSDAIIRQIAHYGYHVGQIVMIGKMVSTQPWTSLSIPRGQSRAYNQDKFSVPKHTEHFTDEYIKKP